RRPGASDGRGGAGGRGHQPRVLLQLRRSGRLRLRHEAAAQRHVAARRDGRRAERSADRAAVADGGNSRTHAAGDRRRSRSRSRPAGRPGQSGRRAAGANPLVVPRLPGPGVRRVGGAPLEGFSPPHPGASPPGRRRRFGHLVSGQARLSSAGGHRAAPRMIPSATLAGLVLAGVAAPALLLAVLGGASLVNRPLPERWTSVLAARAMAVSSAALAVALAIRGAAGGSDFLSYGAWSGQHERGVAIEFLVDRFSLAFAALSTAIVGVVSAFSNRYLHREPGYNRYFVLLAMFVTGMLFVALAGNVEVLFVGWELVGLSSALLVAFFHERPAPVSNGGRVLAVSRISDAAMLSAAVWLRAVAGSDSLSMLFSGARGGHSAIGLSGASAMTIALLLIVAVAGKSALLPFSGWLPRAMEGPT